MSGRVWAGGVKGVAAALFAVEGTGEPGCMVRRASGPHALTRSVR